MASNKKNRGGVKIPLTALEKQLDSFEGFVELISLSANDPTVINQNIKQTTTKEGYVEFGIGDNQFEYLLTLYVNSVTHNAIVDSVAKMTYGKGLNTPDVIAVDDNKRVIKDFGIFGNFSLQVTEEDIFHIPVQYLRAVEADEDGFIEGYWFSTNFSDKSIELVYYPTWTEDWRPSEEFPSAIYYGKTYSPNAFYYGLPSYQGGLSYMEQEIEVAKFLLHYIKNNFSVTTIINFNNGTSDPKSRDKNTKAIKDKFSGTEGDKIIVSHNKSKEHAADVIQVTVSNASEQYGYMTENARSQIVVAHQIVSPLLVGIRDTSTGFSSNSEELLQSRVLLEDMKIEPDADFIAQAYREIKRNPKIAFISSVGQTQTQVIEQTEEDLKLKKVNPNLADALIKLGVDEMEGFELIFESDVDYDTDDEDDFRLSEDEEHVELASTGTANPTARSSQDTDEVAVRYRYRGSKTGQRQFCSKMVGADKIYRKEDVIRMGGTGVNSGFGPNGSRNYSIWLYKGGVNCYHKWTRQIYVKTGTTVNPKSPLAKTMSVAAARKDGNAIQTNSLLVAIAPINMPNQGALN